MAPKITILQYQCGCLILLFLAPVFYKYRTNKNPDEHGGADYKKVKAADSILIIGGGPVGVELAGEIVVDFPTKKVRHVKVSQSVIRIEYGSFRASFQCDQHLLRFKSFVESKKKK
jgi:hypothetical protein